MDEEAIADALEDNAAGPAEVQGDAGRVKQHPLPDQIAAHQYAKAQAASDVVGFGLRMFKIKPGGCG